MMKKAIYYLVAACLAAMLLAGCRSGGGTSPFAGPTEVRPDTVNRFCLPVALGYVSGGGTAERGRAMWRLLCRWYGFAEADSTRCVWRPGAAGDTLWAELGDDACLRAVKTARPDFSHRSAERPDTAGCVWRTVRLAQSADGGLQQRGERLWQRLVGLSRGAFTGQPDGLLWFPADGTADDTLWVRTGGVAFLAVGVHGALPPGGETTREDVERLLAEMVPADAVAAPGYSWRHRFFYAKSGSLRPAGRACLALALMLVAALAAGVRLCIIRSRRRRSLRQQERWQAQWEEACVAQSARQADALQQAGAVRRLHALAARGETAQPEDWDALHDEIHRALPDFLPRLLSLHPALTEKERRVCQLVRLGFAPSEMCVLQACSKQSVPNTRTRLHEKLFGAKGSAPELDVRLREM